MNDEFRVARRGVTVTALQRVGLEKKEEESDPFDVIFDKEVKKVGEEAVLVGQILQECAKGLKVRVAQHEHLDNETAEYIIGRIWSGFKKVIKKTAQVVVNVGKAIIPTKVVYIVKDLIQKKIGGYALAEDKSSGGLVLALAKDMDDLGKALIEKGVDVVLKKAKARAMEMCEILGLIGLERKEESDPFDVIVDNEEKKVGEEAVLVGQILQECAKGLKVRVAQHEHLDNE
ncbi:hypothetical protein HPB47_009192, partial [Ixodes persulcatus]